MQNCQSAQYKKNQTKIILKKKQKKNHVEKRYSNP